MINYKTLKLIYDSPNGMIRRVKKKSTEWQKVFVIHVSKKGLMSGIYKEPQWINKREHNNNKKKRAKDFTSTSQKRISNS